MISALQNHISALEGKVLQNARAAPVTQVPEFTSMKNQLAEALSKVQELQNDNAKRAEKEKELEEALARKQDTHKKGKGDRHDVDFSSDDDDDDIESEDPSRTFLKTADGTEVFWL